MSLDIVNLIENSPLTKLNDQQYNSALIQKIKDHFTPFEQQLLLSSCYCDIKYHRKNDFVIDLDNIWAWLGFSQKTNAKYLLEKKFTINVDYKISGLDLSVARQNARGGQNKEIIMLNIDTFKKMCMKAGTKKADEIHECFLKSQNFLLTILSEESNELKVQLEQQKTEEMEREDKQKEEYEIRLEKQKVLEKEKILLTEYATIGAMFYIIRVKSWENKQYVIKIGESRKGITDRYKKHKSKYEECVLLDCFAVERSRDFETFIKDHDSIRPNKCKTLEGHEHELELFLIGKNLTYQTLINIIENNIKYFNNSDFGKLQLENERLQLLLEMKTSNNDNVLIHDLIRTVKQLSGKIENLERINNEMRDKPQTVVAPQKVLTGFQDPLKTVGPRLQKINPETLALVKVYETVTEAMNEDARIKRPSINKAVVENTVYCGFRWLLVDRESDVNIIGNISPTKPTKVQNLGYIAQINKEQTAIVNVFLDRKTAARFNGYESSSALDNPVKNYTLTNGFYYKIYDKCDADQRHAFEEEINGPPILYKNGVGQYDSDNKLLQEFICKYDCLNQLKMSDKTLTKAMEKNIQYNGHVYRMLPEKLKCF